jgi:hypothetical protein
MIAIYIFFGTVYKIQYSWPALGKLRRLLKVTSVGVFAPFGWIPLLSSDVLRRKVELLAGGDI